MTPDDIARLPYRPCVGVMLVNETGEVFVGQRIDSDQPAWQMPQGGVDEGEAPREAALRELWEETGVPSDLVTVEAETDEWIPYDLPHHIVPHIWKGRYKGQEQKWFLLRFHGSDEQVNIRTDHPEFSSWRWLAPEKVVTQIVPFKRAVYERVLSAFEDRL
ncbi:RNA pyrophosphohydrolase [Salipiger mucosus]|uniref:RNA pyrophosphohydrolase n=1 Tax=Salipiger mucosus DSM 16094 TaxID=1123237 RepID=S9QE86_9RHOB|nr:RNA pyrophosphohydrolase [Salipiger mucosus]EPX79766.1 Adenosine (5')-pentaphospho-(5'')-adenosine pyrophosphohydrolase [Salipiger mucosus DSM 16094]